MRSILFNQKNISNYTTPSINVYFTRNTKKDKQIQKTMFYECKYLENAFFSTFIRG